MQLVYRHPRIHTGIPGSQPIQALAVEAGVLTAVGDEASVRRAVGGSAEVVDLPGEAVVPGLYDAHIHTGAMALARRSVDLRDAADLAESVRRVAEFAQRLPSGAWVLGGWWNSNTWDEAAQPDRYALDEVCGDRPVALSSIDSHTMWVSSAVLQRVGITAATPDPPGGQIVRDREGEPTGILRESATHRVRQASAEQETDLVAELHVVQDELLSLGLTSIHDIDGEDVREAYLRLHESGELGIRVHKAIRVEALDLAIEQGRRTGDGDDWLSTGPLKLFSDGALGSRSCHMSAPFAGAGDNAGIEVTVLADLVRHSARANRAGLAVATHAIGDLANHLVLDAYERVRDDVPQLPGLRNRIEHAQHLRADDIPRMARLGVVASMQPTHCRSDIDLVQRLLAGRDLASYAWRSMLDHAVPLAFGSDAPVESANPFHALAAAVERTRADGTPTGGWQPQERITIAEALRAHTLGSAFAAGQENRKGLLAPGMLADFVALDRDPLEIATSDVRETAVLCTVVGGVIRWHRAIARS